VSANKIVSTLSFDDGHPNDLKVASLLKKYSLRATFYVPIQNSENDLMSHAQIRKLHSKGFEIGSHGLTHRRLPRLTESDARKEIEESKKRLENIVDGKIFGYCFAGGKYDESHVEMATEAGYLYCRSTRLLRQKKPVDGPLLHTTMQYHHLSTLGYLKHIARRPKISSWMMFLTTVANLGLNSGPLTLADFWADKAIRDNSFFHLHGHSYEFSSSHEWKELEALFEILASKKSIKWVNNRDAYTFLRKKEIDAKT